MGFQANVLKVMIASPGDVAAEREIITAELYRWNNANADSRKLILQPIKWETHSSPQMGEHPQQVLNKELLLDADIVVGIFGTRIGTATSDFVSVSVEEIKKQVAAGKLAMLYFSHVPVDPNSIDPRQWSALQTFKEECKTGGLYAEYRSHEQLRTDFGHHLTIELNKPKYLWLTRPAITVEPHDPELSEDEIKLLIAAESDPNGQVLSNTTLGGFFVQTNGRNFVEDSARSAAAWKRILRRLDEMGYLDRISEQAYELTDEGFARADKELGASPLELSLSFGGKPDSQELLAKASKPIAIKQLDFLTSSEATISSMEIEGQKGSETSIPLEHKKIVELFNAPRPDRNHFDHAGPAALRVVFETAVRRSEVVLPIMLQPVFVNHTQWIKLNGSKVFSVSQRIV
jgi:hypothetical protein